MIFEDREHAGRLLAEELERFRADYPIVLGLTRGGVPAAYSTTQRRGAAHAFWPALTRPLRRSVLIAPIASAAIAALQRR